jgi:hypothetical protein
MHAPPQPSKRVAAHGFEFHYDRYSLASHGFKLVGMQVRAGEGQATGYLFEKSGHVFLGSHVTHAVSDGFAFLDAMELYDDTGILAPQGADAEAALGLQYHAYQLTSRWMVLRMLLGQLRSRMVGPWISVVLGKEAEGDRRLSRIWESVSRDFRNDPVALANAPRRITVPMWFAAFWVDRAAASSAAGGRPRRPPPRSRVPRLVRRFTI